MTSPKFIRGDKVKFLDGETVYTVLASVCQFDGKVYYMVATYEDGNWMVGKNLIPEWAIDKASFVSSNLPEVYK